MEAAVVVVIPPQGYSKAKPPMATRRVLVSGPRGFFTRLLLYKLLLSSYLNHFPPLQHKAFRSVFCLTCFAENPSQLFLTFQAFGSVFCMTWTEEHPLHGILQAVELVSCLTWTDGNSSHRMMQVFILQGNSNPQRPDPIQEPSKRPWIFH